jgi:hypothetical protein
MGDRDRLFDIAFEISSRLKAVDLAVYTGSYDQWYPSLRDYVDGVLQAIAKSPELAKGDGDDGSARRAVIVKEIENLTKTADLFKIQMDIESSIRMDFFEFKQKWDQSFPSDS